MALAAGFGSIFGLLALLSAFLIYRRLQTRARRSGSETQSARALLLSGVALHFRHLYSSRPSAASITPFVVDDVERKGSVTPDTGNHPSATTGNIVPPPPYRSASGASPDTEAVPPAHDQ
jgi:hypothetical protein